MMPLSSGRVRMMPVVGVVCLGIAAVLTVVGVHRASIRPASLLALVDLQPKKAEESFKPIHFREQKEAIVQDAKEFSECVQAATTVDQGVWCLGQLLSMLPRPLEQRALEVAHEVYPSKEPVDDPKLLAMHLESCLAAAQERDGGIFCVAELLAHVPPAALTEAVTMGEEHPAFDWTFEREAAMHDAETFGACASDAKSVEDGVECLGRLLTELPEAMVQRSVHVAMEVPPPMAPAEEPAELAKDFGVCLELASARDAAMYCLSHLLARLPAEQLHEAFQYQTEHRGRGEPFLTDVQEEPVEPEHGAGLGLGVQKPELHRGGAK